MAAPVSTLRAVCSDCGVTYTRETSGGKCPECKPPRTVTVAVAMHEHRRGTSTSRGYDERWRRLSERARRRQPFCSDCGRTDSLTTDHSPEAWARREAGKTIRLQDVDVVCVVCNAERGPARGPEAVERPTMGSRLRELDDMAADLDELEVPDDLDQRVARDEW